MHLNTINTHSILPKTQLQQCAEPRIMECIRWTDWQIDLTKTFIHFSQGLRQCTPNIRIHILLTIKGIHQACKNSCFCNPFNPFTAAVGVIQYCTTIRPTALTSLCDLIYSVVTLHIFNLLNYSAYFCVLFVYLPTIFILQLLLH